MRFRAMLIVSGLLLAGCASRQPPIDPAALNGKPYADVVRTHHLDAYHSWPDMNTPPDQDPGVTYFLERGDLTFKYSADAQGNPATVHDAKFWPSERSAEERFQRANEGWNQWVAAHGGSSTKRSE